MHFRFSVWTKVQQKLLSSSALGESNKVGETIGKHDQREEEGMDDNLQMR
jgi:hypothetical protein